MNENKEYDAPEYCVVCGDPYYASYEDILDDETIVLDLCLYDFDRLVYGE